MSEKVYKSLSQSLREAGEILGGRSKDFRQTARSLPAKRKTAYALAICMAADDDDLIAGKLYNVRLLPSGNIAVRDESGETVITDQSDFILVEFRPSVERKIREIVGSA